MRKLFHLEQGRVETYCQIGELKKAYPYAHEAKAQWNADDITQPHGEA